MRSGLETEGSNHFYRTFGVVRSLSKSACFSVLAALIVFRGLVYPATAQKSIVASMSIRGVVKLPVIDKHDIRFTRLSVAGESFQSRVSSITQDRYGFLWFGTDDGLYRYDGYNLKPYRREPGHANSLSDDTVRVVHRDRAGILWVGTGFGGLDRLDPARNTFTHYRHDPANRGSLSDNAVNCIYQDTGGALWVGTDVGLDRLDPASGTFVHYVHNPQDAGSLSGNLVVHISEDHLGNLWVGTSGGGLNRLDRSTGRFSRFRDPNQPRSPGDDRDWALCHIREDHSGVMWVGFAFGTLDPKTGSLTRYAFRSKDPGGKFISDVRAIQEDRDGVLWVGTVNGLLALDRERKQFVRYIKSPVNPHSLHNEDVLSLFEDVEGNIWVGTQSGVSRFNRKPRSINSQQDNTQGVAAESIRAVQVDSQGVLWVGTARGLQRLDLKTSLMTLYQHDPHDPRSLSNNYVTVIREDRSGTLWVGTGGGGLNRFDSTTGRFFAYRYQPNNPAGVSSDAVLSLLEDRDGMLWVATAAGLSRWDRQTGRFTTYHHVAGDPHSLSNDVIKTVFEDRDGILWVGSNGGLNRFDRVSQQFTAYRHNPQDAASLSHDAINAIWEDRRGTLWIATQDGLNQMDRSQGAFRTFTRRDGLPDNAVQAILEDDQGSLWLATHNGLSHFDPQTRTFRNYSESDGLAGNFLNPIGAEGSCRTPNGELVFGSTNGVTEFDPDRVADNPYVPPVELTDFLLFNTPVHPGEKSPLRKSIWATDSLTLNHRQSIFTLEFAALSYVAPERNRYRYRLEGLENNWNEVDSLRRLATYTSLPAGNYVFRVQGSNNDGVWNEKGATLRIAILPPWWATWWFRSIVSLMIAGLVFVAYRSRVTQLALRFEERLAERTRIAQELHDTLIQDVVAVGLQLDILDDQRRNEPNAVEPTFALVRQRVTQLIDHGRRTLWDLRSSTASPNDLVESLSRAGTELRTGERPDCQVFVQGDRRPLHSLIRDELDRIGREAITNAFRHAHANSIEVGLFYSHHALRLVVRDDGHGIAPHTILKGRPGHFGLTGMRERAERIGGRLTVQSRVGGGTEVSLLVPLHGGTRALRVALSRWLGRWIGRTGPPRDEVNTSELESDYEHAGKDSYTQR